MHFAIGVLLVGGVHAARTAEGLTRAKELSVALDVTGPKPGQHSETTENEPANLVEWEADPIETTGSEVPLNISGTMGWSLIPGPAGGTVISEPGNSRVLGKLHAAQLVRLGGYYVRYSHPALVRSIWSRAAEEADGNSVTAMVMVGEVDLFECLVIFVGLFPALVSVYAATCALPWFVCRLYCGRVLSVVEADGNACSSAEASFKDLWIRLSGETPCTWVQCKIGTALRQIEKALHVKTEPSYTLRRFHFTEVVGMLWLGVLVFAYQAASLGRTLVFNTRFLIVDPTSVGLSFMVALLGVVDTFYVFVGIQEAKASPLVAPDAVCPVESSVELRATLESHVFWKTVIPSTPSTGFFIQIGCLKAYALIELLFMSSHGFTVRLSDVVWDLNKTLVKMAMFIFILHASLLARIAKAHVESVKRTVLTVYKHEQDGVEGTSRHGRIDMERMELLHAYVVKLAESILPSLRRVGRAAVVSVLCSFVRTVLVTLTFLASERSVSDLMYVFVRMTFELSACICLVPLTDVSDACDQLLPELNKLRAVCPKDDPQIRVTESYIKNSNRGQGLGFVMAGLDMVVNRRMLLSMGAKMLTLSSIALTFAKRYIDSQRGHVTQKMTS